ncbi:hypothetical protein DRN79_01535 [Methanosarcinales archaeon]|nr:MAG: hypothetical protein DRN79_01535 [Methanosarcinales archaeon]
MRLQRRGAWTVSSVRDVLRCLWKDVGEVKPEQDLCFYIHFFYTFSEKNKQNEHKIINASFVMRYSRGG